MSNEADEMSSEEEEMATKCLCIEKPIDRRSMTACVKLSDTQNEDFLRLVNLRKDTKLYDILRVLPTAETNDICKTYRQLMEEVYKKDMAQRAIDDLMKQAMEEKWKRIDFAYYVLSDTIMRSVYDEGGVKALEDRGLVDDYQDVIYRMYWRRFCYAKASIMDKISEDFIKAAHYIAKRDTQRLKSFAFNDDLNNACLQAIAQREKIMSVYHKYAPYL